MRRIMLGLAFPVLGLAHVLASCNATMEPSGKPAVDAVLNVPFTLSAGQTAVLGAETLSLTFVGVLTDSRCPIDTVCIQAGNATMSVQAKQEGKAELTLNLTLTDEPHGVAYEGFRIHAQRLTPDRVSGQTIRPEDYLVRLLVD